MALSQHQPVVTRALTDLPPAFTSRCCRLVSDRRAEEALGGCPETKGRGDANAREGRQAEAPSDPRGAAADHRGDEEAVGGASRSSADRGFHSDLGL
jgi:hypothetical protein